MRAASSAMTVAVVAAIAAGCAAEGPSEPDTVSAAPEPARASPPGARPARAPDEPSRPGTREGHGRTPSAAAIDAARRYAATREGVVSFATVASDGRLRGFAQRRRYPAASVVKAMLLAAELRRLKQEDEPLDAATDSLLEAMVTASDNAAADAIHARVGDPGLDSLARRMRMARFAVAGHWGNAQLTAADTARLFAGLDRAIPRRHREYGKGLLGSVLESQRWGVPAAAGERWAVRLKGGWLPDRALVHQGAELRRRGADTALSIAVFTDSQPSFEYGVETIEGVSRRLLERPGGGGPAEEPSG